MPRLSLRPDELRIQSFPTADLRGGHGAELATVGQTCGALPDSDPSICADDRAGATNPRHCCV